jgi:hypothetical protein
MRIFLKKMDWKIALTLVVGVFILAYGVLAALDYLDQRKLSRIHNEMAQLCLQKYAQPGETIADAFRSCVHENTTHNIDDEFYAHWKDEAGMAQSALDYLRGTLKEKPHFECSTRTGLMLGLLEAKGIKAQDLIVARFEENYNDHVVVGVWNPEKKSWDVHDPSYDIFLADRVTKIPATAHELLLRPLSDFVPCTEKDKCSWDIKTTQQIPVTELFGLWGVMAYKDLSGEWDLLYNQKKFDPYQVLGSQSYCEKRRKYCEAPDEIGTLN